MPAAFSQVVSRPSEPSVEMKAKASGTPAKLAATAEKLVTTERSQCGAPGFSTECAISAPATTPTVADATDRITEFSNATR